MKTAALAEYPQVSVTAEVGIAGLVLLALYLRRRIAVTLELGTVVGSTGKE